MYYHLYLHNRIRIIEAAGKGIRRGRLGVRGTAAIITKEVIIISLGRTVLSLCRAAAHFLAAVDALSVCPILILKPIAKHWHTAFYLTCACSADTIIASAFSYPEKCITFGQLSYPDNISSFAELAEACSFQTAAYHSLSPSCTIDQPQFMQSAALPVDPKAFAPHLSPAPHCGCQWLLTSSWHTVLSTKRLTPAVRHWHCSHAAMMRGTAPPYAQRYVRHTHMSVY